MNVSNNSVFSTNSVFDNHIVTDSAIRLECDQRGTLGKIRDWAVSIFRDIGTRMAFLYRVLFSSSDYHNLNQNMTWGNNRDGLVVFLHGLHGHPCTWDKHLEIVNNNPEINADVFVPFVPERGNCSLEEATDSIYRKVRLYAETHVGKPICFVATSNGGRIASLMETRLRQDAPSTPVKVASVAGAHFGSAYLTKLNQYGIAQWFIKSVVSEELAYGSNKARELLNAVVQPLESHVAPREYEFWASTEDITIGDLGSNLPNLGMGETKHLLHAQSHISIVDAVAAEQMDSCAHWLRRRA